VYQVPKKWCRRKVDVC